MQNISKTLSVIVQDAFRCSGQVRRLAIYPHMVEGLVPACKSAAIRWRFFGSISHKVHVVRDMVKPFHRRYSAASQKRLPRGKGFYLCALLHDNHLPS